MASLWRLPRTASPRPGSRLPGLTQFQKLLESAEQKSCLFPISPFPIRIKTASCLCKFTEGAEGARQGKTTRTVHCPRSYCGQRSAREEGFRNHPGLSLILASIRPDFPQCGYSLEVTVKHLTSCFFQKPGSLALIGRGATCPSSIDSQPEWERT